MDSTQNNIEQALETKLQALGYSPMWREYGVLDSEILHLQYSDFTQKRDDFPTESGEHYRYAAFRHYLGKHPTLSDAELEALIVLAEQDSERSMAVAALVDVVRMCELTEAQSLRLREVLSRFGAWSEKFLQINVENRSKRNDRS
ncbi:MAG: hypothetical protein MUF71_08695 [Candidatus Kapabacteria bacterium]|jgi:hypothetical protein|nr:hypothetical protein [Candidatus Kapabacteria bacterium]